MRLGLALPVRLEGRLDRTDVQAEGTLRLFEHAFAVAMEMGDLLLPYDALDGAVAEGATLVLTGRDGSALRIDGLPDASDVAQTITGLACTVPEVLRSLRGFASVASLPDSDHATFFEPLLAARKAAHAAADYAARVAAFDGAPLKVAMAAARGAIAERHHPGTKGAADRRALAAELEELCSPMHDALGTLVQAAASVRGAPLAARLRAWRWWCETLARVYEAADQAWVKAVPVLADSRGTSGRFWRRVLRRKE
jgi:hypothetical protein